MKRTARLVTIFGICGLALFALVAWVTWPLLRSQEVELTGLSFELSEVAFYDHTGSRSEGERIWVYQIPDDAAQRLLAKEYLLRQYPMCCGLAFDGYKRIRWTPSNAALSAELQRVLKAVIDDLTPTGKEDDQFKTMHDARQFAAALVAREGTLVAGWYTIVDGRMVTNYFVYVLNLEQRVLVKLSLLT